MLEPKHSKNRKFKHPRQAGFGGRYFFEILVSPLAFNCQSVGALFLSAQKCWSSCFKRQKVWELSFQALKSVGALVSSVRKCGSYCFEYVGALPLNAQLTF